MSAIDGTRFTALPVTTIDGLDLNNNSAALLMSLDVTESTRFK